MSGNGPKGIPGISGKGPKGIDDGVMTISDGIVRLGTIVIDEGMDRLGTTVMTDGVTTINDGMDRLGVITTRLGTTSDGVTVIIEGMFIGPIGPTSRQGKTIGGSCGVSDGIGQFGMFITGRSGSAGSGIVRVGAPGCGLGSVTTVLSTGVWVTVHLLLDSVIIGSIVAFGA